MATIGLLPGGFKPVHAGHWGLIEIASRENDAVKLFVSTSDRIRPGEFPLYGKDMLKVWRLYLEPALPDNVEAIYGGVPVSKVYEELEMAEASGSEDVYQIYSDVEDILKYTDESLRKSAPTLFENEQIKRRGVNRNETVNVSGTKMRAMLAAGDVAKFASFLPPPVRDDAQDILDTLSRGGMAEGLVRRYVRNVLSEDDAGYHGGAEGPYGVTFGSGQDMVDTFLGPFLDVAKTAIGQTKEITRKGRTVLWVGLQTVLTTLIPIYGYNYDEVFEKEKADIEKIRGEYKDVYDRTNAALSSPDTGLIAFMASPALVLGYVGAKKGAKAAKELLSAVTGGGSDQLYDGIVSKAKSAGRWSGGSKKSPSQSGSIFDKIGRNESQIVEDDEAGGKKPLTPKSILTNKKFLAKALSSSPKVAKMQEDAKRVYQGTLKELVGQVEFAVKKARTVDDVVKIAGKKATPDMKKKLEEVKKLPPAEKKKAEELLISNVRKGIKDFYLKGMKDHIKKVVESGIPKEADYVKAYLEAIQKIEAMG